MAIVPIVVLAGQSNAALAGVDNRLFEQLAASGNAFELVKVAEGGTALAPNLARDWDPGSGELFSDLVEAVQEAVAHVVSQGHTPVVTTLWVQGEADREEPRASLYDERLIAFIDQYRSALGIADAPFHISMLQSGTVRDGQIAAAAAHGNVHLIETRDLILSDGLHYDRPSRNAVAERFMAQANLAAVADEAYTSLRAPISIVKLGDGRHEIIAPYFEDFVYTHGNTPVRIYSFSGDDQIGTGSGDDFINAGDNDNRVWAGLGNDRIRAGVHNDRLFGQGGDDMILGLTGSDLLVGAAGNDDLNGGGGVDTMIGGTGDDIYTVEHVGDVMVEFEGQGIDEVRTVFLAYTLGDHLERLVGIRSAEGQSLTGNDLNNYVGGGAFEDVIDGGPGADQMDGRGGNDTYIVDQSRDVVIEAAGGGVDLVKTSLWSYSLGDWVENLTGTSTRGQVLTGNDLRNEIWGNAGGDILNGGGGIDTLVGGKGHDIYIIDQAGDVVVEIAGEGIDEVRTSLPSHRLAAEIERLTGMGNEGQHLAGNGLANVITGGDGADILDGWAGSDAMHGFGGDDTYYVNQAGDMVVEAAGGGQDEVRTSLLVYSLGAGIENLTALTGLGHRMTGNGLWNVLAGGAGNDVLDGGRGTDTMIGGAGDDVFLIDRVADVVVELSGGGTDEVRTALTVYRLAASVELLTGMVETGQRLVGNSEANVIAGRSGMDQIEGAAGADLLDGGAGSDIMKGGTGNDVYVVDILEDVVEELLDAGSDEVRTALSGYRLPANVEILTGLSSGGQALAGNGLANAITGGDGNDVIEGGAGDDVLSGGAGIDTASYTTAEAAVFLRLIATGPRDTNGAGFDTLSGFENVIGSAYNDAIIGDFAGNRIDGREGADYLSGLNGVDALFGGSGKDTLNGGIGDDILDGGADDDRVIGGAGFDLLRGGVGNDRLEGGTARDLLEGNGGNDVIVGGRQPDVLTGGTGADRFVFGDFDTVATVALADRITDFEAGDLIDLSEMQADGPEAFAFIGQSAFSAAGVSEVRYRYAMGNTYVEGDGDGDGQMDFTIRLDAQVALTEAAFVL